MAGVDTTTELLGKEIPLPLVLAPTGFTRIADPQGELAVARAAGAAALVWPGRPNGVRLAAAPGDIDSNGVVDVLDAFAVARPFQPPGTVEAGTKAGGPRRTGERKRR